MIKWAKVLLRWATNDVWFLAFFDGAFCEWLQDVRHHTWYAAALLSLPFVLVGSVVLWVLRQVSADI